jgi:hypothetical protein
VNLGHKMLNVDKGKACRLRYRRAKRLQDGLQFCKAGNCLPLLALVRDGLMGLQFAGSLSFAQVSLLFLRLGLGLFDVLI